MNRRAVLRAVIGVPLATLHGCTAGSLANAIPDFRDIVERAGDAVVAVGDAKTTYGSGFRVAGSSRIVTAAHVVRIVAGDAVVRWRGESRTARILARDDAQDLAVLEIAADAPIPGILLAPSTPPLRIGEWVIVLGSPFGTATTAAIGIVGALPGAIGAPAELRTRIQLDAAINPGNSGGPVLDLRGRVVAVALSTIPGGFGLGFAAPASAAESLIATGARQP